MTKEELKQEAEEFTDSKKSFWRHSRLHCDEGDCMYCMGYYDNETYEHITFCPCDFDIDDEGEDYDNNNQML